MLSRLAAAALLAALLAAPLAPPPAAAQAAPQAESRLREAQPAQPGPLGEREVALANRSTLVITEIYVSPTSTDAWGEDRLGEATLEPGRTLRLRLGRLPCVEDLVRIGEVVDRPLLLQLAKRRPAFAP